MSLTSGTRLGPYTVDALIGAGGMGEVYKARDIRLDRTVALKILPAAVATPDRVQRFEQEARTASALNHPNILTIHDVGRDGDLVYFAMEWVDGRTLRELMAAGRLPLARALELSQQVAEGLAKAHTAGIVHRDLKPENVMVTAEGHAKIVDFGLAKMAGDGAFAADQTITHAFGTTPGLVMGTFGYMSPEQASGRPVDYRSDQFALGLLIYELATGIRPFTRATTAQTLAATIEDEPPPIERHNPAVPAHLAAVVARCLAKDPADRYESTRDLARDLKHIAQSASRAAVVADVPGPRRVSRVAGAVAALLAILLASAAWLWWSRSAAPPEPARPLIAVRALQNLSPDPAQGYFAAGLTEEIHGQLSQVSALRLLSRSAVDAYSTREPAALSRELGVSGIVEGTVRVEKERVRIGARLIDATTQQTLWADQYDRNLADVFTVQSDVALRIARALHASLSADERDRVERRPTDNFQAYDLYLQAGQLSMSNRTANMQAMDLLRQALALDPRFATAQAHLAYRSVFMGYYDDPSWVDKGLAEAEAALRVDPLLAHAYYALGSGYGIKGMDGEARLALLRALELDPSHTSSMNNLSINEAQFGRLAESLHWARRSFALSAKRGNDYYHVAVPLLLLRDDALTRRWLAEGERRFAEHPRVQIMLALQEVLDGRPEAARRRITAAIERQPQNEELKIVRADIMFLTDADDLEAALAPLVETAPEVHWMGASARVRYAYALGRRGEHGRAAAILEEAERSAERRMADGIETPGLRLDLAVAAALRQDRDTAIAWLSRAYDAGYRDYGSLERDPVLSPLASDRRFLDLLDRIRRDVASDRDRARERGLLDLDALLPPSQ